MRLEVQLAPTPIGYVGVELRRGEVGVTEHLLNAPQVGAALEEVRGERVAQEVRVDAGRVEAGLGGQTPQNEERARAGQRATLRVEKQLRPMTAVEVRPSAAQVAAQRLRRRPSDRDDPLLAALADAADEALLQ